jgi:hypothetical protein
MFLNFPKMQDDERLREERKKAKKNKDKYVGMSSESMGFRQALALYFACYADLSYLFMQRCRTVVYLTNIVINKIPVPKYLIPYLCHSGGKRPMQMENGAVINQLTDPRGGGRHCIEYGLLLR